MLPSDTRLVGLDQQLGALRQSDPLAPSRGASLPHHAGAPAPAGPRRAPALYRGRRGGAREASHAGRFVLATNVLDAQDLSDAERLRAYKGPPAAELRVKWAKNPAAIAPIFLETPTRIAALGCVYLMALLVYTLVERHVEKLTGPRHPPPLRKVC